MCIALSLPVDQAASRESLAAIVLESAVFQSAARTALIGFDIFVLNEGPDEVHLLLTHLGVPTLALFATGDYLEDSLADSGDTRVTLLKRVYGKGLQVDPESWVVELDDAISGRGQSLGLPPVRARLLITGQDERFRSLDEERSLVFPREAHTAGRSRALPAYVLRDAVLHGLEPDEDQLPLWRPFSTYEVGPFVPARRLAETEDPLWTLLRVTIELRGEAFDRLVTSSQEALFEVTSSTRVIDCIRRTFARGVPTQSSFRHWQLFETFFNTNICQTGVEPVSYQIVLAQPVAGDEQQRPAAQRNRYIQVRPTSSHIRERYIHDPVARQRAMWYYAGHSDFSLVMKFGEVPDEGQREEPFRRPLLPTADTSVQGLSAY
jgi:hypothetical protein